MKEQIPLIPRSRMGEECHLHLTIREIFAIRYVLGHIKEQPELFRLNHEDTFAIQAALQKLSNALPKVRKV
jgi:hypothetical protein